MALGHNFTANITLIKKMANGKSHPTEDPSRRCPKVSHNSPELLGTTEASLSRLPNELLVMIAQESALSEEDLVVFAGTCRSIRLAVLHVIYAVIVRRQRIPILHWAAENGLLDLARRILDTGVDPNQFWYSTKPKFVLSSERDASSSILTQDEYWSILCHGNHDAVRDRCSAMAPRLCLWGKSRWASPDDDWIDSRLQWAWMAQRAGLRNMKFGWLGSGYLEGSTSVPDEHRSPAYFKWTALHLAVYHGHTAMVELLLSHGSDLIMPSAGLCTCTKMTVRGGEIENHSSIDLLRRTAVHLAVCRSRSLDNTFVDILNVLLDNSEADSADTDLRTSYRTSPVLESLALAAMIGDERMVQLLLDWTTAHGFALGCPVTEEGSRNYTFGSVGDLSKSNHTFLLEYGIVHCAVKSHHWDVVARLAQAGSSSPGIMTSLESLLQQSAGSDEEASVWLLRYGVAVRDKAHFLRSICPAPASSIHLHGQQLNEQCFEMVMHVLKQCTSADINAFSSTNRSHNALGHFLAWHFSLRSPSKAGDAVIKAMMESGGDLHRKNPKNIEAGCRIESDLTPLDRALMTVVRNTAWGALSRFSSFIHQYAQRCHVTVPEGEYLHKFFFFFGYGSVDQMPDHTLVNIARVLLVWGAHPEERDADGGTALFAFLHYLRMFVPAWIASEQRPYWFEEIIYLLACLQKHGARLGSADAAGRTAEDELRVLQNPQVPFEIFYSESPEQLVAEKQRQGLAIAYTIRHKADHEELEQEMRRRVLAEHLMDAVRIVRNEDGTCRMRFRRPRTIFKDLLGDDFIQQLLQDDDLWWS